ncbi:hypothetical protein CsatB_027814 [Cannabis sativa]
MSSLLLDDNDEMYSTKKDLFNYVMKGKWDKVVELYNDKPIAHKAKITKSGDTALHLAISEHQESVVEDLVKRIREKKNEDVLRIQNEIGCTPLHFAVSMGSRRCRRQNTDNCDDEVTNKLKYAYCRRTYDGETILQCAIIGEYFGIYVDHEWKIEEYDDKTDESPSEKTNDSNVNYPQNNQVCVNFFELFKKAIHIVTYLGSCKKGECLKCDLEKDTLQYHHKSAVDRFCPLNNIICFEFGKLAYKTFLVVVGLGYRRIEKLREYKLKHRLAVEVLEKVLECTTMYEFDSGNTPPDHNPNNHHIHEDEDLLHKIGEKGEENDSALLVAAKNGIMEIVEKILQHFPVAIHDTNKDKKNIFLLAVENRRLNVLKFLAQEEEIYTRKLLFRKVDKDWNCALHLASIRNPRPWPIPGDALQMQWELNWYKYVETFMPSNFYLRTNKKNQTPQEVFTKNHKMLVKSGGQWLTSTATACSVIAVLIATVAFATSTAIPGGTKESNGKPKLENYFAFDMFAILSLVALCFSITALVMFLSILTSRYEENDFAKDLPTKLFLGLTSLFVSIASIIGSFCAAHFFVLEDNLSKHAVYPVYAVTCLPITIFAFVQFPLYVDLIHATFRNVFE